MIGRAVWGRLHTLRRLQDFTAYIGVSDLPLLAHLPPGLTKLNVGVEPRSQADHGLLYSVWGVLEAAVSGRRCLRKLVIDLPTGSLAPPNGLLRLLQGGVLFVEDLELWRPRVPVPVVDVLAILPGLRRLGVALVENVTIGDLSIGRNLRAKHAASGLELVMLDE